MRQCKSVQACIDLALTDAYGEDERGSGLADLHRGDARPTQASPIDGQRERSLASDLRNHDVVAVCQQGKRRARVTLDSVEFPLLTSVEQLWLRAWK
jgi:hypothetical protein